jgi:hypothetical protein
MVPGSAAGSACRIALKEMESLCARLAEGRQILLLRKGGIAEPGGAFEDPAREFFLFPTRHHERGEAPPDRVDLALVAVLEDALRVDDLGRLRGLEEAHGLSAEDLERRFRYRAPGLQALLLRVWTLARPLTIPDARRHDGCRSWVELDREHPVERGAPALDEADFAARVAELRKALRHG